MLAAEKAPSVIRQLRLEITAMLSCLQRCRCRLSVFSSARGQTDI